jgi:parallel beta-helix repeat protein
MRRFLVAVALACAAFALQAPTAFAATLVVDDDRRQCPNAQFTTINQANLAAAPGDTIQVCAGLYPEIVPVTKPDLTFRGAGASRTQTRSTCLGFGTPNPNRDSIVDGQGYAFFITAQDVDVIGFVIQSSEQSGIYTSGVFSGYDVRNNVFLGNTNGVYLNASGLLETRVEHNCFRSNNLGVGAEPPVPIAGDAIYSDQGLRNAEIEDNTSTGHAVAFLVITGVPSTVQANVQIENNDLVDDNSIALFFLSDSEITHNRITRSRGTAILLGGANVNNLVKDNQIFDGNSSGIALADFLGIGSAGLNTMNTVEENHVDRNRLDGIALRSGAVDNLVVDNLAHDNGRDGIAARAGAVDNRFLDNDMDGNGEHDAHDDNRPLNVWEGNSCDTDFPPGTICGNGDGGGGV